MQKISRTQQLMLTLPGLVLLAAFFIGAGAETLIGGVPQVAAAEASGSYAAQPGLDGCTGTRLRPSFGSAVEVLQGEVICGDVTAFGGSVLIRGEVDGDVVVFGGNVVIDGAVNGSVTLYDGNLALLENAHVNGDIHVCGGHWTATLASAIHGNTGACTQSIGTLLTSDSGNTFRFWSTLTWVVLGLLLTFLLPEHVMFVRTTVKSKLRRSLVLGLLTMLLAPAILVVLAALIIAIPLALIVAIGLFAAWALGTVAVGWLLGDFLVRTVAPQQNTRLLQIVVGMAVLALAGSLPIVGWLISLGAGLVGLGAVFLSRFGTRLYTQPRKPFSL